MPYPYAQKNANLRSTATGIYDVVTQGLLPMLGNAARGSVAATLGTPGDILGLLSDRQPFPTSQNILDYVPPVGKDKVLADFGETMGQFVPVNPMSAVKAIGKTAVRELGPLAAQKAEQLMVSNGMMKPITAYHGSPHKFDRFSLEKIGTGEGAQVYGHGLYFADNPAVAEEYKRELASRFNAGGLSFDGKTNTVKGTTGNQTLDDYLLANLGNVKQTRSNLLSDIKEVRGGGSDQFKDYQKALADLRVVRSGANQSNDGSFYKVDIPDEAVANMLLWDKPLSEQPEAVRKAIGTINEDALAKYRQSFQITDEPVSKISISPNENSLLESIFNDPYFLAMEKNMPSTEQIEKERIDAAVNSMRDILGLKKGSGYYKELSGIYGTPEATSQRLQSLGIPGVRYLDQGSRSAGSGTMNTVVFDDSLIKMLERNGVPMGLLGD